MSNQIVPNNCDEDIPEIYDELRRGPLRIEDVPISILEQTEDYVMINKPVIIPPLDLLFLLDFLALIDSGMFECMVRLAALIFCS
jgi:hypothetical protein